MAATFRTRPWLLVTCRPSISPPICAARGLVPNRDQTRQYASRRLNPQMRGSVSMIKKGQSKQEATSTVMGSVAQGTNKISRDEAAVLAPGTFIPLPPSQAPQDWRKFLTYYYKWAKQRVTDRAQIMQQTLALKEGRFWHRATFRARREGIVDTALDLHAAMSHSLARGGDADKAHLATFCVPKLARSLAAAVEARPAGKRYWWERLALTGKPLWPRLVDHKWTEVDMGFQQSFRQAVVGIQSRQRLTELDAKGNIVRTKEMELREYMVLWAPVDPASRTMGNWKLYGTLKETTWDELLEQGELMNKMTDMYAAQRLLDRNKQMDDR